MDILALTQSLHPDTPTSYRDLGYPHPGFTPKTKKVKWTPDYLGKFTAFMEGSASLSSIRSQHRLSLLCRTLCTPQSLSRWGQPVTIQLNTVSVRTINSAPWGSPKSIGKKKSEIRQLKMHANSPHIQYNTLLCLWLFKRGNRMEKR